MKRWVVPATAGILTCALSLAAVGWTASATLAGRRNDLEIETRVFLGQFGQRLRSSIDKHVMALEQMAAFIENSESVTPEEFRHFATTTIRRLPACARISFIDPSYRLRMVHPLEPNTKMIGFETRAHPMGHQTILSAVEGRVPVFSPPMDLLDGDRGFILGVPVIRRNRFVGILVGAYRASDFAASLVQPQGNRRYSLMALNSGAPIDTASHRDLETPSEFPVASETFTLGRVTWEVRARLRPEAAAETLRSGMTAFWTLGFLVSVLLGGAACVSAAWIHAVRVRLISQDDHLRATRERLDGAMHQLMQAEKMTALGDLVAGVAHEINNPLASIMGYTQLALAQELPEALRRRLETVSSEAERMARIVRNLLTFARKHPPERTPQDLNAVLDRTLELKAYHFRVNQIRIEKDLAADLPQTLMDPHQLQQVIINLLNNAEQAMAEAGRGGTIRLSTRARGDRIELRVADDGPGIPEENRERVFEPFFTTKKAGKGTGLGLSLCYGIVQGHGGSIRVEGAPGSGAVFRIELPIVTGSAEETARKAGTPSAGPALHILVIDPEQAVSRFLVDLLSSRGHRVETAEGAADALKKIAARELDLIISDLEMFGEPGRGLYLALQRQNPRLQRRVIFTTGTGSSGDALEFIRRTGNEILHKPCRIEDLEGAIARAVRT